MKKLTILFLSLVMTMSFATVSFAAGENTGTATMPNDTESPYSQSIDVYGDLTLTEVDLVKVKTLAASIEWTIDDLGITADEIAEYKWNSTKLCYEIDASVEKKAEVTNDGKASASIKISNIGDCDAVATVAFTDKADDAFTILNTAKEGFNGAIATVAKNKATDREGYTYEVTDGGTTPGTANFATYEAELTCTAIDASKIPDTKTHITLGNYTVTFAEPAA